MPGPILWGPNNNANNLQNDILNSDGSLLRDNGPKNYIRNATFENQLTTGWSLFSTTMSGTTPTGTVSVGATGLTLGIQTTGTLSGAASLQITANLSSTGIWPVGTGFISDSFIIDIEDQSKPLNFGFSYNGGSNSSFFNWSGTSANTLAIYVYDVIAAAWVTPVGLYGMTQGSGTGKVSGFFQPASPTSNIFRIAVLAINSSLTAAGASNLLFDNFFVGPVPVNQTIGPIDFNGTQSSQAVTGGTTNITLTAVKDSVAGWSTNIYTVQSSGDYIACGSAALSAQGAIQVYKNGAANGLFSTQTVSGGASAGSVLIPSCVPGDTISFRATSSVTVTSGNFGIYQIQSAGVGPAGQVVAAKLNTLSSTSLTANTAPSFTTVEFDTSGALSGGNKFTCPVSGWYQVSVASINTSSSSGRWYVAKNGSFSITAANTLGSLITSSTNAAGYTVIQCNANDTLQVAFDTTLTVINSLVNVTFTLVQGPSAQTSTPTVACRYTNVAGTVISGGSTTQIPFATKDYDTTNSWNGTQFTAPYSGKYKVTCFVYGSGTSPEVNLRVYKNGSLFSLIGSQATFNGSNAANGSDTLNLVAGDTIQIYLSASTNSVTLSTSAGFNHMAIERVGN